MTSTLVFVGVLVAAFVGFNIGGSSTGVAFGPAVGSRLVRKVTAAALFTVFAFLGAWTVGRNVIVTMSDGIVPAAQFSPAASVGVLFFTGLALLLSNLYGVPASTSMTAVGAIVGLGLATESLDEALMFTIVSAWIVAPLLDFALVGVYRLHFEPIVGESAHASYWSSVAVVQYFPWFDRHTVDIALVIHDVTVGSHSYRVG